MLFICHALPFFLINPHIMSSYFILIILSWYLSEMEIPINQFCIILQRSRKKISDFLPSWPAKDHPAEQRIQNEHHIFDCEVPKRKHGSFMTQRTSAIKTNVLGEETSFVLLLVQHSYLE